jgi:hypothetical protein
VFPPNRRHFYQLPVDQLNTIILAENPGLTQPVILIDVELRDLPCDYSADEYKDGTTSHAVMSPLEFMQRLAALVWSCARSCRPASP